MNERLDHLVGRVFVDRYEIEALLGDGATGVVYRARHLKIGRKLAIKILKPRMTEDRKLVERFEREAELAGAMQHPNIANVVDLGRSDDGLYYYAMELAPGESLALLIGPPMDPPRAIEIARQICDGLSHAHEAGLVHRDLKPDNIIVDTNSRARDHARIVDFGLAIPSEETQPDHARGRFTTAGMVVGTPHYMAPEQARGEPIDHRTDLYALGLILYEMLTGMPPFEGSGVDVALAHVSRATPTMGIRVPTVMVDPLLEALVLRLLEKDPALRIQTAAEVRDMLDMIEHHRYAAARALRVELPAPPPAPAPEAEPEPPPTSRRRWIPAAGAAAAAALAFAIVLGVGLRSREQDTAANALDIPAETPTIPRLDPAVYVARDDPSPPSRLLAPIPPPGLPVHTVEIPKEPTATELAQLYAKVGRELSQLERDKGTNAAIDLWPRYRWIRINDSLSSLPKRIESYQILEQLHRDVAAGK